MPARSTPGLRDLWELLRRPAGLRRLRRGVLFLLWPLTSRLARLYRFTFARKVRIIAVVGSLGKTTAVSAIAAALDVPTTLKPGANSIYRLAVAILCMRPRDPLLVLETGIERKGQMAPISTVIRPEVAVVTSIGSDHCRSLGTLESTRHEKAYMVRCLPPSGVAVLNGDDPNVLWMRGETRARVVTFGFGEANQIRASAPQLDWPRGMRFRLRAEGEEREVRIGLFGRHMIYPALAAVAVALEQGVQLDDALERLEKLVTTPGRMAAERLPNGAVLLCDEHKSSLESIHAALDLLDEVPAPRKFVVLGPIADPPGPQGPLYRDLGARIARVANVALFVDSYREYKAGVRRAGMPRDRYVDAGHGVSGAVEFLRQELRESDVVLIKGRNDQKLGRIALVLSGVDVGCRLISCNLRGQPCATCPQLRG